jgi:hypothetical protein
VRGAWNNGQLGVGHASVQIDSMFQADFVVIGHHDERAACDLAQVVTGERRLASITFSLATITS